MSPADSEFQPVDPLVGRILSDRYRVLRPLGEGGIGRVYLAEHMATRREVALKVLLPEFAGNIHLVDTFLNEARTVSRLGHENIIDIYYGGRSPEGYAFLVMEYLKGHDLADTLATSGPMHWDRARPIFLQVASALAMVHEHGVVHGDIKPANLFLVSEGARRDFVKVLDFGVAKAVGLNSPRGHDDRVPILGTPQYIAPEQVLARATVDARSDLYSLGCVLYQVATGSVPFWAETPLAIISKHAYERPVPPRVLRPDLDIPPSVEAVIMRALEKEPEKRWQSMAEMGEAINRARIGTTTWAETEAHTPAPQFRMSDTVVLRGRRKRRLWAAAISVAAAIGVAITAMMVRAVVPGMVDVSVEPRDATIVVDAQPTSARPPLRLSRGKHRIGATRPGYVKATQDLELKAGEHQSLSFQLRVSPDTGVEITSDPPGALVWLDDKPVITTTGAQAETTYIVTRVAPGRHVVELRSGPRVWRQEVDVPPNRIIPVNGVLPPAPRTHGPGTRG